MRNLGDVITLGVLNPSGHICHGSARTPSSLPASPIWGWGEGGGCARHVFLVLNLLTTYFQKGEPPDKTTGFLSASSQGRFVKAVAHGRHMFSCACFLTQGQLFGLKEAHTAVLAPIQLLLQCLECRQAAKEKA